MVAALPVREKALVDGSDRYLADLWKQVTGTPFDVNPNSGLKVYVDDLEAAEREGTLKVVNEILGKRG